MPQSFTKGANVVTMTYTADGEKLAKAVTCGGTAKNYVAGIEYSGAGLEAIYHAEGRCTPNGTTAFYYEYTLKDYLGNARVNFRANGASITFLEETHYYPFGMPMEGIGAAAVTQNKYRYNGKEMNEDFGLNWLDYGKRWYDPAIGRFPSVDPLADTFNFVTPYNYAENEPVRFLDMFGMDASDPNTVRKERQAKAEARMTEMKAEMAAAPNKTESNCPSCPQKSNYTGRTFVADGQTYTYANGQWGESLPEVLIIGEQLAYRKAWMYAVLGELGSGKVNLDESTNPYIWTSGEINAAMDIQLTVALTIIPLPAVGGLRALGLGGRWVGNAATREGVNTFVRTKSVLGHIFRDGAGHVNPLTVTSQNRYIKLFESVGNNSANINPNILSFHQRSASGFQGYSKTFRNGKQVWVQTFNNKIINAGVNIVPK